MYFAHSIFKVIAQSFCILDSMFKNICPVKKVRTSGMEVSDMNRRCNEYSFRAAGYTKLLVLPLSQRIYVNDQTLFPLQKWSMSHKYDKAGLEQT